MTLLADRRAPFSRTSDENSSSLRRAANASAAADASHLVSLRARSGPFDACEGAQDFDRMGGGVVGWVADTV